MRAVIYARYSSDNQRDESIIAQVRAAEDFCRMKKLEIVNTYIDKAKSATTDKRPQFQQLFQDAKLGLFDAVIVHKLDRFARDRYDSAFYKRILKKCGIKLMSITENLDGSPESVLMESVLEGMAEFYSKNLAREVMKGMKETAYQCKHTGGTPALGYDVGTDKKYVINELEAVIVRKIFDMYVNGHGYKEIRKHLNDSGYKTKKGNPFTPSSIRTILVNEKYSGVYIFNLTDGKDASGKRNSKRLKDGEDVIRVEGGMPAIISKETFNKAKEMITKRKKSPAMTKAKEMYLLQGLIRCGECGAVYEGNRRKAKNKPLYVSYRCGGRRRKLECCNKEIRREYIEGFVLDMIEKKVLNDEAIPLLVNKINDRIASISKDDDTEKLQLSKRHSDIKNKIKNFVNAISQGLFQQEFVDEMEKLKQEQANIEMKLLSFKESSKAQQITENQVRELFSEFRGFIKTANIPECKRLIQDYVKEVVVYKDHIEVIFNVAFLLLGEDFELIDKAVLSREEVMDKYKYLVLNYVTIRRSVADVKIDMKGGDINVNRFCLNQNNNMANEIVGGII